MQVAAIMPTKTGVLTWCRGVLRGTARLAWACPNWPARRNARWDGKICSCQDLHTNAPNEDIEPTHQETRFAVVVSVLRHIHYRDVDNPRCYMSDEVLRDIDMYAKSNVRVETPHLPNPVDQERLPQADLATHRTDRAVSGGQGHLLARAATVARSSERDEGITLRPQPETLRLCSGQKADAQAVAQARTRALTPA